MIIWARDEHLYERTKRSMESLTELLGDNGWLIKGVNLDIDADSSEVRIAVEVAAKLIIEGDE